MERISKENYYLDIAQTVLERATCLRRIYGAIIVKNDEIISTGYNGAPRGRRNCVDMGYCTREAMQVPRGQRYELCRSVHAEANAIISASRRDMVGSTLYLVGKNAQTGELLGDATSCAMCRRMVINAGISRVVIRKTEAEFEVVDVQDWVAAGGRRARLVGREEPYIRPAAQVPPGLIAPVRGAKASALRRQNTTEKGECVMLNDSKIAAYTAILPEELLLATGCTEPIAVAYCAAKLREVLGGKPEKVLAEISGNILKNVKSVVVPNTAGAGASTPPSPWA